MSDAAGGRESVRKGGLRARVLPGSTAVWVTGALIVLVGVVLLARILLAHTASTTGTNSVDVAAVIARAEPDRPTCIKDLVIPKETGRLEIWLAPVELRSASPRIEGWVQGRGGVRVPLHYVGADDRPDFKPFDLTRRLPRDLQGAQVCIVARDESLDLGGASVMRLPGVAVTTVGGQELAGTDIGVRFLRFPGDSPRVLDAMAAAIARATLFDPGFARVALYLVGLLLLLAIYPILRVAATVERHTVRRLAAAAALLAFVHSCVWILLLQPFHGADESEHFAYAQHLAATGHVPDSRQSSTRPPYSSSESRLLEAVNHNSTVLNSSSRMRWEPFYKAQYERSLKADPTDTDGGGYTESATGHSPLYYGIIGLPYRLLGRPDNLLSSLLLMRLFNALLAAAVAALAVLTAALLFPRRRAAAWLAGVLVALQPVFGSVSAAVNNDTAVNVLGAALLYLLVRSWRCGFRARDAALVGCLAILLPVAKITGFALLPTIALAGVALALQHGRRSAVRWAGVAGAAALATALAWVFVVSPVMGGGRGALRNVHPPAVAVAAPAEQPAPEPSPTKEKGAAATAPPAVAPPPPPPGLSTSIVGKTEYFVKTFIPPAPFGPRRWAIPGDEGGALTRWPAFVIYIDRGYGLFGWLSTSLSFNVLRGILLVLSVGWLLALVAAVRARRRWRTWAGGVIILGGALLSVLAFVSFAYVKPDVATDPGEQGRYVFTALVPLAVLFAGAVHALRGRAGRAILGAGSAAAWVIALIAATSALRGWYM